MEVKEELQLSDITVDICNRLKKYKNNIKNDMVIGDTYIISGIELVEKIIREINPTTVSEKIVSDLEFMIRNYNKLKEKKMQSFNNYTLFGIQHANMLVALYVNEHLQKTPEEVKIKTKKLTI